MVTRRGESNEIINIIDDIKAAASDALKKCATSMGVALYLYEDNGQHTEGQSEQHTREGSASQHQKKITEKQHKEIGRLTETLGLSEEEVSRQISEEFSKPTDQLSIKEASEVIQRMRSRVNR